MDKKNFSNLGDEIKDIIQNAINTRDFEQLNRDIQHTVKGALNEVKDAVGINRNFHPEYKNYRTYRKERERNLNKRVNNFHEFDEEGASTCSYSNSYAAGENQKTAALRKTSIYPSVPVGRVSGILYTVFGWLSFGISSIAIMVLTLIGVLNQHFSLFGVISMWISPLAIIGLCLIMRGGKIRKRLKRFHQYRYIFKNRSYYEINNLITYTGVKRKKIIKDLRKMISIGMFPEGHIDDKETCIMLNQDSFQQYVELHNHMNQQEQNNISNNEAAEAAKEKEEAADYTERSAALKETMDNGQACMEELKRINETLSGENITQKITRLEIVINKILEYVTLHPEQLPEIQKFMSYYLPTTLKLVKTYQEFNLQPVQGENILTSKKEIENTIATINQAFETLLDNLFEETAMDVSTDIAVLKTMLAQEGLTKETLTAKKAFGGYQDE